MLLLDLGWFESGLRVIMAWLCSFIYKLIASLFELFINISKVELLRSEEITPIYQRVTMILTIIMVFYVTFELVKYIIQPDTMKDKEKGASKVVVRMILVVVLIAFVPTAFRLAYRLQNAIIEREVLSKVILGRSNTSSESFGRNFSADMFSLFYYFDTNIWDEDEECEHVGCQTLVDGNISSLRTTGQLENLSYALNDSDDITENGVEQEVAKIHFDGLFAVLVGGFLVYVLILYCIDLGVRVAQITFLQIIAPIPIIGYLSPKKDNIFNKWVKQCTTTYLDLFIRLSLIYFILLICKIIADAYNNGTLIQNVDQDSKTYVYIAIIMGLLLFAQKAPKMLQELFPKMGAASGNFGLKAGERVAPLAARAIGAGTGFARAGIRAAVARGKNVHDRNKRLKEHLREEGKPTDRKSMRHARKEAKNKAKESKNQLKEKSRELTNAEKGLRTAEKEKKLADERVKLAEKGGNAKEIEDAKNAQKNAAEKLKKANINYETVRQGNEKYQRELQTARAKKVNTETRLKSANDRKKELEKEIGELEENDPKKAELEGKLSAINKEIEDATIEDNKAKKELAEAEKNNNLSEEHSGVSKKLFEDAERKLNEVNAPGSTATQEEKDAAQRRYEQAKQRYELDQSGYLKMKNDNITAQSELADQRNQTYGSYAGVQAATAFVRGGLTGAAAGVKAKKLGDVWKQSNEGIKKVIKNEDANVQYLQNGGSATFSGTVDRTIAQAQQKVGIKTQAETMKMEIKDTQDRIKLLNSEAEKETQVKTFLDSAKQRSGTKLDAGEQKIFVDNTVDAIKMSDGTSISWEQASGVANPFDGSYTTSTLLQSIREQENRASNEAESANQVYNEARANSNLSKLTSERDKYDKDSDEYKKLDNQVTAEQARITRLGEEATEKSRIAEEKKAITKLARKKLLEYGVSKAIQGDRSDNILYDTVNSLRAAIEVSRNIPAAREHVRKGIAERFGEGSDKFNKVWGAFINNSIQNYEQVDVIEGLLTNHVGILKNNASLAKGYSDRLSESSWKGSADAAAGSGSSNK